MQANMAHFGNSSHINVEEGISYEDFEAYFENRRKLGADGFDLLRGLGIEVSSCSRNTDPQEDEVENYDFDDHNHTFEARKVLAQMDTNQRNSLWSRTHTANTQLAEETKADRWWKFESSEEEEEEVVVEPVPIIPKEITKPSIVAHEVPKPSSSLTTEPTVDLPKNVRLCNPFNFARVNIKASDAQQIDSKIVIFDFRNLLNHPELSADVQEILQRLAVLLNLNALPHRGVVTAIDDDTDIIEAEEAILAWIRGGAPRSVKMDPGETIEDGDADVVKELKENYVVDQRALLHLKLEPASSLLGFSRGFDADRADLEDITAYIERNQEPHLTEGSGLTCGIRNGKSNASPAVPPKTALPKAGTINCKFSHKAPAPKPKAKAEEASTVIFAGPTYSAEWAADTAAGRHLGGPQSGEQFLGVDSHNMDVANHFMLDSCPLVRSTGIDVESGKAFLWLPGSLPLFVSDTFRLKIECPEDCRHYATRVDEHVPIFTSQDPAGVPSAVQSLASLEQDRTRSQGIVRVRVKSTVHATIYHALERRQVGDGAFSTEILPKSAEAAPSNGHDAGASLEVSGYVHRDDDYEGKDPEKLWKLRDQAMTLEHRRVRRKLRDPDEEPDPFEASEFGEVIAVDHIHAFRSPDDSDALDKSYVVLCVRENFGNDRSSRAVVRALTKFVGSRPSFLTLPKSSKKQLPRTFIAPARVLQCLLPDVLNNEYVMYAIAHSSNEDIFNFEGCQAPGFPCLCRAEDPICKEHDGKLRLEYLVQFLVDPADPSSPSSYATSTALAQFMKDLATRSDDVLARTLVARPEQYDTLRKTIWISAFRLHYCWLGFFWVLDPAGDHQPGLEPGTLRHAAPGLVAKSSPFRGELRSCNPKV
ncbi:unnamed protein product [Symbiodinium necroappetens]|uniref:Uncharacterized protein n=1 Tax=Symbiodinium necroappetens TaxID=1628268 RepID=A0A813C7L1_9DINO|nr:unnamed protein product [Symbiodinium necroappetens]